MTDLKESTGFAGEELTGKLWRVKVIKEGQGSSANYKGEVLKRDIGMFKSGTKIYMNHASLSEQEDRPERDAREIIGYFTENAEYDDSQKAVFQKAHIFADHREWVRERAIAGVIGLSISAQGEVEESESGTRDLIRLTKVNSVDVVTEPGAGGEFTTLLESKTGSHRVSEEEEEMEFPKELAESLDATNADVKSLVDAVTALIAAMPKAPVVEAAQESKKPTYAEIDTALTEAELPAPSRTSVFAAVEAGADLTEAVAAEKSKVEAILESAGTGKHGKVDNEDETKLSEAEAIKAATARIFG